MKVFTVPIFIGVLCSFALAFTQVVSAEGPLLRLTPSSGKYAVNTPFSVDVFLDTGSKKSVGTDLVLTYDTRRLELIDIKEGTLYPTYTGKSINPQTGKAFISGIVKPEQVFNGSGVFATLTFKAQKEGKADVTLEFSKGERNDSNIADVAGNDMLASVENGTYQVVGPGYSNNLWDRIVEFIKGIIGANQKE